MCLREPWRVPLGYQGREAMGKANPERALGATWRDLRTCPWFEVYFVNHRKSLKTSRPGGDKINQWSTKWVKDKASLTPERN